jgi:hypothetical protein
MFSRPYRAALAAVLTALAALALTTSALAAGPRERLTATPVFLETDDPNVMGEAPTVPGTFCGFPVRIDFVDFNQFIIRRTVDPVTGATILRITGRARATVTNLANNKSVSFNISGPGTQVINTNGSFSLDLGGPNLLWTAQGNLANFPDVPNISYTTGHVTVSVDASGQTTSYNLAGGSRQTDVCALLR